MYERSGVARMYVARDKPLICRTTVPRSECSKKF